MWCKNLNFFLDITMKKLYFCGLYQKMQINNTL